jgi:hypothetical protein
MMNDLQRAYKLLHLEPGASPAQVEEAYRDAARHWHPNHFPPEPDIQGKAQAKLREIDAAYQQVKTHLLAEDAGDPDAVSPAPGRPDWRMAPDLLMPPPGKTRALVATARAWVREHAGHLLVGLVLVAGLVFSPLIYNYLRAPSQPAPAPAQEKPAPKPISTPQALPGVGPGPGIQSKVAPPASRGYFSLGSSPDEVRATQGPPQYLSATTWKYGLSTVTFKNRRVVGYANISRNLRVRLTPKSRATAAGLPVSFTVGSSKDLVLIVQGTPSMVVGNVWKFGESEVKFRGNRVVSYDDAAHNLQVKGPAKPRTAKKHYRGFFTLGSSKRWVLTVQGHPTHVWGNTWWYGYSRVDFYYDRVIGYADVSRNLKARVI